MSEGNGFRSHDPNLGKAVPQYSRIPHLARCNGPRSQDLLVMRRSDEVSLDTLRRGLIQYWCEDPQKRASRSTRNVKPSTSYRPSARLTDCVALGRAPANSTPHPI